ncbi:MAG: prolipoprotein diacylglyceryl transferase [Chloroflexi bacterium]|nr:prolipoprotein diacylglyceryl transferase [Chloroflexota bacterium]
MTPFLAIEIPWDPNITRIGGFLLSWHGLFTAVGILAGVQLALRMASIVNYDPDEAYTIALVGVPSGIVGARAMFVIENWDFYGANPGEIIAITEGGISIWGAILGGILGGLLFALWRRSPIARGLDAAAFGLLLGQAIGRLGDLVNGEHLARPTGLPWGVVYTNPESPAFAHSLTVGPHHPATTYEMLGDFALLGLMFWLFLGPLRRRAGVTFFVYFIGYAVLRFLVTYLRVDSAEVFSGLLRVPQLVSVITVLISLPGLWWVLRRPPEPSEEDRRPLSRVEVRAR